MRFTEFPEYMALRPRHRVFVLAYVKAGCKNKADAARKAGYVGPRADQAAYVLAHRADVQAAIKRLVEAMLTASEADVQARVIDRAVADRTALFDAQGKLRPVTEWPAELRACVQGLKFDKDTGKLTEVMTASVTEASKLFLQMRRMLTEVHQHQGPGGGPLQVKEIPPTPADALRSYTEMLEQVPTAHPAPAPPAAEAE